VRRAAAGAGAAAAALASGTGPAAAHDAFGDLGPFHASFLHPLADPGQGLLIVAAAVLLARQPLATVQLGWPMLAAGGAAGIAGGTLGGLAPLPLHAWAVLVAVTGVAALPGPRLPALPVLLIAAACGFAAGLALSLAPDSGALLAGAGGGILGIALGGLLVWGFVDLLVRRVGPVAGAVAGSWVAALGLLAAALPG
jgi:hypothetical protein